MATRGGNAEFDLRGGEEEHVYIARKSLKPGEDIQLCYAADGIPDTIPLKPAWRVNVRLVLNNAPHKDATFQMRVSSDGSLVGMLLDDETADELTRRKRRTSYVRDIYAEAVKLRNTAFSLRVLDAKSERQMDSIEEQLVAEMYDLAPERSINLETINTFNERDHPPCLLQELNRGRALAFSEVLARVMKILGEYN